jgi:hypothetical protein
MQNAIKFSIQSSKIQLIIELCKIGTDSSENLQN